jgi:pimeloyl-ACP methyl ester carboxylesterase
MAMVISLFLSFSQHHSLFLMHCISRHGEESVNSVESCASDLAHLVDHLRLAPTLLCGHSFSGKVVVRYAHRFASVHPRTSSWSHSNASPSSSTHHRQRNGHHHVNHLYIMDTYPLRGCPPSRGQHSSMGPFTIDQLLDLLKTRLSLAANDTTNSTSNTALRSDPIRSRTTLKHELAALGVPAAVASFLSTSVRARADGSLAWRYDFAALRTLYADYRDVCLLEEIPLVCDSIRTHFLRGARSDRWAEQRGIDALHTLSACSQMRLHTVNSGHWVGTTERVREFEREVVWCRCE